MPPPTEHHGGVPPISDANQRAAAADLADFFRGQLLPIIATADDGCARTCSTCIGILCQYLRTLGRWGDKCRHSVLPIRQDQQGRTRQTPIGPPLRMVGGDRGRVDPSASATQHLDDARSASLFVFSGIVVVGIV